MKNLFPFLMLSLLALMFTQCANPGKTGDDSSATDTTAVNEPYTPTGPDNLTEIYWKLAELKNIPLSGYAAQNKTPYLMLRKEGNRAEGTGGCNSMGGSYQLSADNGISFSQLMSTKMACPDMMMENEFQAALEETRKYHSEGKVLTLLNEAGIPLAKFVASAPE